MPSGKRVVVLTDSTSDLPREVLERYQIRVIPLNVIWGGQTYRDGVDITSDQFYRRLRTDREFPTTSQPSVGAFREFWEQAAPDPDTPILSIHIAATLSGTIASAEAAKALLPGRAIEIVDSCSASLALGHVVLAGARAAEQGQSLEECTAAARALVPKVNLFFQVETLEFLHRGGRIGGAVRLVGTMLNLKPLLYFSEGRVEPLERVRTRARATERMLEIARSKVGDRPAHFGVLHAAASEDAARVIDTVRRQFNCVEMLTNQVTPTLGAHVGPGALGMGFYAEE